MRASKRLSEFWRDKGLERNLTLLNLVFIIGVLLYATVRAADSGVHLRSESVAGQVQDLLWFALLCGLVAYASLEIVKRLTSLRGSFQLALTHRWFDARLRWIGSDVPSDAVLWVLLEATGMVAGWESPDRSLRRAFDLAPEQLLAQIAAATDVALTDPDRYGLLLAALLGPDFAMSEPGQEPRELRDDGPANPLGLSETQRLRASLDGLQVTLTQRWRRVVQAAAIWIAGIYGILVTFAGGLSGAGQARYLLAALILGGPVAWLARDLTAVLERLRDRT